MARLGDPNPLCARAELFRDGRAVLVLLGRLAQVCDRPSRDQMHRRVRAQGAGAAQLEIFVEEFSGGALDFQFFPSAQLGDKLQSLEGLRNGSIEMSESSAADLGNYSDLWDIFSLPFLFNNGADAVRVITDPRVAEILDADAEANGFKIIGWWNLGERSVINSVRPVVTPDDLDGIKIRVMQNPMLAKAITAMGATGIPMAWSEVYLQVHWRVGRLHDHLGSCYSQYVSCRLKMFQR